MIEVCNRKLFVGGIDTSLSEWDVEQYFSRFGPVASCTIHRNRETGRSRGFGFVTFREPEAVEQVQQARPHSIHGCEVTTKRAVPRELFQAFDGLLTVTKVFVGGIPQDVTEQDIRDYFSSFGRIRRVDILVDRNTHARRGFGFVEFDDYDPVDKAVLQQSHVIKGQDVTVKKAKSRLEMELIRHQIPPPTNTRRRNPYTHTTPLYRGEPSFIFDSPAGDFARLSLDSFDFGPSPFGPAHPFGPHHHDSGRFMWL